MKERTIPMLLVIAAAASIVLLSQNKLIGENSVAEVLFAPGYKGPSGMGEIGTFGLAFMAYLMVVSALNDREAAWLTGALALGALAWNQHTMGEDGVLAVLFAPREDGEITIPAPSGDSNSPITVPNPFGGGN